MADLWAAVLRELRERLGERNYLAWIEPIEIAKAEGELVLRVPSVFFQTWIERHFADTIREVAAAQLGSSYSIRFVIAEDRSAVRAEHAKRLAKPKSKRRVRAPSIGKLNPNFTLDSFVVGPSNEMAFRTACDVCQRPGQGINPLFLHGGVGLGKTHLINAIAHELLRRRPGVGVACLAAESFMNDLIRSLRLDQMNAFRERFRRVDALILDDIQFLAGKERTQEEFYHTFNELHAAEKQIVMTSDKSPAAIVGIEKRLRSRFEGGLIADIRPPTREMRTAILYAKAERKGVELSPQVAEVVVKRAGVSVRELEGALNRVIGFADVRVIAAEHADGENNAASNAGESYVVFGKSDWAGTGSVELASLDGTVGVTLFGINSGDEAGFSVSGGGDVNGDGFDDLLVSTPYGTGSSTPPDYAGESYVVFGKSDWSATPSLHLGDLDGTDGFTLLGIENEDYSGFSISGGGDLNGDGFADLLIGANNAGESYVVFGKSDWSSTPTVHLGALGGTNGLTLAGVHSGRGVSVGGDLNGDGFDDLVIGAAGGDGVNNNKIAVGESHVVFGRSDWSSTPSLDLAGLDGTHGVTLFGVDVGDRSGWSVSVGGDLNGDGFDDLVIGAIRADASGNTKEDAGESYVVFGKSDWSATSSVDLSALDGANGLTLLGVDGDDISGISVSMGGDVNGDGFDDLIIGAIGGDAAGNTKEDVGESYVVFGQPDWSSTPTVNLGVLNGFNGLTLFGVDAGDSSGVSVSLGGDLNGDGFDDLVIGAGAADGANNAKDRAGESYVVFGGNWTDGLTQPPGDATANTLTGSAEADVLIGGQSDDTLVGGGGGDVLRGGEGNDALSISDTTFLRLVGGNGNDTLRVDGDSITLDLTLIPDNRVTGIEKIDLVTGSGDHTLVLNLREVLNLSDESNTLVITGDTGDLVSIGVGWTSTGTETVDGIDFDLLTQGTATLKLAHATVGTTAQTLIGTTEADVLIGGGLGDTLVGGGGGDVLRGGQGDDTLSISDLKFLRLSGGNGNDTLRLEGHDITLDLSLIPDNRMTGIERIDLDTGLGDHILILNQREVLNLSDESNTLIVTGGADDRVSIRLGWTLTGTQTIDGADFDVLEQGAATLVLAQTLFQATTSIDLGALEEEDGSTIGITLLGVDVGDYSGHSVSMVGDLNGDGFDDLVIGAVRGSAANNAKSRAGESYVVFGRSDWSTTPVLNLGMLDGTNGFTLFGIDEGDFSGSSVSGGGDFNGDGFDDLVIGAEIADGENNAEFNAGEGYVVFGKSDWSSTPTLDLGALDGTNGFILFAVDVQDRSGISVSLGGDLNGDGFDDLVVGANRGDGANNANEDAGESYVIFGKSDWSTIPSLDLSTLDGTNGLTLFGIDIGDSSGFSVSLGGDLNGDGFEDLVIGAFRGEGVDNTKEDTGESYVVFGKSNWSTTPTLDLSTLDGTNGFIFYGVDALDQSGFSIDVGGDINGDGFDDLLIGARHSTGANNAKDRAGESYVVFGRSHWPASLSTDGLDGTHGLLLWGADMGDTSGRSVSAGGDVNGDGFDDLLIGAPLGAENTGTSYVVFGKQEWSDTSRMDLGLLNGFNGLTLFGIEVFEYSGGSISVGGDVNGDGFDDLLIGAGGLPGLPTSAGKGYVVFGRDWTGALTQLAGDVAPNTLMGSAEADVLIGGQSDDMLAGGGGADVLRGGQGDDTLSISDLMFMRLAGGNGNDKLRVEGGNIKLDLTSIPNNRITGIERIELAGTGNHTLKLNVREVLNLSDESNTLIVTAGASDTFHFGSGWRLAGTEQIDGKTFGLLTQGAATLKVFVEDAGNATVVGRHLFYNDSVFDVENDDNAIATDKAALLPTAQGQTATFANYSSYTKGLNGIMIDIQNLFENLGGQSLQDADFLFRVGNNNTPDTWTSIVGQATVDVRVGEGVDGSDRVAIIFPDHLIKNQWLQVTVKPENTGLTAPDVFYFGNAVGETGDRQFDAMVNLSDLQGVRQNATPFGVEANIVNLFDFNRDGVVNLSDGLAARDDGSKTSNALNLLTLAQEEIQSASAAPLFFEPLSMNPERSMRKGVHRRHVLPSVGSRLLSLEHHLAQTVHQWGTRGSANLWT